MTLIYVAVAAGGAFGSVLRYVITQVAAQVLGTGWPYGTWMVNAAGSLLIGVMSVILSRYVDNPALAAFFITGFLGGFTTFSSFMNETMQYMMSGLWLEAFCYLGMELGCGLFMVFAGIMIARTIF